MKYLKLILGVAMASLITTNLAIADTSKKQIESVVHDYILQNPDVLVQSLQSYQQKQAENTQKVFQKIQEMAPKHADRIFRESKDPVAGNPNGKVTVVEFSDYQCPHCVTMTGVIDNVIKKNPNVRVVLKEFPIRGPMSETAAKAALAAHKQGKYYEFHVALMNSKVEPLTEAAIFNIAANVGLDVNKLKADMKDDSVNQNIKNNYKLAQDLQLIYTPVFFIAKTDVNAKSGPNAVIFIPGGVGEAQLLEAIEKMNS